MEYPNQQIYEETDLLGKALLEASGDLKEKFQKIHEELIWEVWNKFTDFLEFESGYCFQRWIRQTCDEIIEGLLSGDTKWLKHKQIISDYDWEKLQKVRLAILKANGDEIESSTVNALLKENEELKRQLKSEREYYRNR